MPIHAVVTEFALLAIAFASEALSAGVIAGEKDSEREDGGGMTYVRIQYFGICSRAQLFGSHGWKHSTLPLRSQTWQRPSPALFRILFGGTTAKPLGPGLMRARHQPSSPK